MTRKNDAVLVAVPGRDPWGEEGTLSFESCEDDRAGCIVVTIDCDGDATARIHVSRERLASLLATVRP